MKTLILSSVLFISAIGAEALACSMTPLGASTLQMQTVVKHLNNFDQRGAVGVRRVTQLSNRIRAELNFERASGAKYCRAYDFTVMIEPDCSARVATQRGAYRCQR